MKLSHLSQKNLFVSKKLWLCGTKLAHIPAHHHLLSLKQAQTHPLQKTAPAKGKFLRSKQLMHPVPPPQSARGPSSDVLRGRRKTDSMEAQQGWLAIRFFLVVSGRRDTGLRGGCVPDRGPLALVRLAQAPVVTRVTRPLVAKQSA